MEDYRTPQTEIDRIAEEFADLHNKRAEESFWKNPVFQREFKFEPGERILYLNYQNLKFVLIRSIIPLLFLFFLLVGTFVVIFLFTSEKTLLFLFIVIGALYLISMLIGAIFLLITSKSYRYIITDRRIVVGYTFLQRWARSVDFYNIVDIVVRKGLIARLFNTGEVMIITGASEGLLVQGSAGAKSSFLLKGFMNIKNPFRVKNLIKTLMLRVEKTPSEIPPLLVPEISSPTIQYEKELALFPDEKVFKVFKMKRSSSIIKGLVAWAVIPLYFIQILPDLIRNPDIWIAILKVGGIVWVIGALVIILLSKAYSSAFEYVITNYRVIMLRKFINLHCRDVIMGKITDVSIFQMAVGRIANFGMITIGTKGFERLIKYRALFNIQGVANVPHEKDDIRNLVLHFQRGSMYAPAMEIYDPEFLSC